MVSKNHILLIAFIFTIVFISCNRNPGLNDILFKETKNKVYKNVEEEKLSEALKIALKETSGNLKRPKFIGSYYKQNGYQAILLKKFLPQDKLNLLLKHLASASDHGLNADFFHTESYQKTLDLVSSKDAITNIEDAYKQIAKLEIETADALLSYSSTLKFGAVNPNKVLKRYYIETQQADSTFWKSILESVELDKLLDSIQPKSTTYLALQKALKETTVPATRQTIMVNMERLRWKQNIDPSEMVYVNIPAYRLDVIRNGHNEISMKVVVGTGRNNDGSISFSESNKRIKDIPHSHETPVLSSRIHSVQVNPEWNIPTSIAGKEILRHVQNDRYYLSNVGIDVLQDGKVIEDPENIDWSVYSPENLPYRFRQRPGSENSLGKIKFLFKNNSSVYLHDTPAQAAFDRTIRASSHGCVRVSEPLDLAQALFGTSEKFNTIKNEMEATEQQQPKNISLPEKTQIVLDYKTIELRNNKLQFYPDVYGQDIVLYSYM